MRRTQNAVGWPIRAVFDQEALCFPVWLLETDPGIEKRGPSILAPLGEERGPSARALRRARRLPLTQLALQSRHHPEKAPAPHARFQAPTGGHQVHDRQESSCRKA